jgi:hypothetical protein
LRLPLPHADWIPVVPSPRFDIDGPAGSIVFSATSSLHPIRSVGSVSGWMNAGITGGVFTEDQELEGRLDVPLNGLSSGNPLIDREMKRRLGAGLHPAISASLEQTLHIEGNRATITGSIDFLGASALVEGEITILPGLRLVGSGEFDVRWWGLEPPRLLMVRVEPIVTVELDAPLVERP